MLYAKFRQSEKLIWAFSSSKLKMLSAYHRNAINFSVNGLAGNDFEFDWMQFISSQFIIVILDNILSNVFIILTCCEFKKNIFNHNLKNTPILVKLNYCYDSKIWKCPNNVKRNACKFHFNKMLLCYNEKNACP